MNDFSVENLSGPTIELFGKAKISAICFIAIVSERDLGTG